MADQFDDDVYGKPAGPAAGQDGFVEDGFGEDDGFVDDGYVPPADGPAVIVPPAGGFDDEDKGFSFADEPSDNKGFSFADEDSTPAPIHEAFVEPEAIREWRLKRQEEMAAQTQEELQRKSKTRDQAAADYDSLAQKRDEIISTAKAGNKTKEEEDLAALAAIANMPTWEAVATLVEADAAEKKKKKKGEEDAKKTDVSRMRQLLIKLKNNPPAVAAN